VRYSNAARHRSKIRSAIRRGLQIGVREESLKEKPISASREGGSQDAEEKSAWAWDRGGMGMDNSKAHIEMTEQGRLYIHWRKAERKTRKEKRAAADNQ